MPLIVAALLLAQGLHASRQSAADLARRIRELELDPQECYRVREITLGRDDARFYFTDGHLIFGKPIGDARVVAVFAADVEGADAEVLLLPPHRSERRSLASYTGAPNLEEHFKAAVLIFTDDAYAEIAKQIRANSFNRKTPEIAPGLMETWGGAARNLASSFETRLVRDLLSGVRGSQGFFSASLSGNQLGNFDIVYDPRSTEQLTVGQVVFRDTRAYFDIWTSFEARSFRNHSREAMKPDFSLKNFRIEARLEPDLRLEAVTKVTVTPAVELRVLPFEISRQMRVSAARIDGQPAEVLQRESLRANLIRNNRNDVFLIVPEHPLAFGRDYEIELQHDGAVISEAGDHVYYVGARGNWYPNYGFGFANYDLTFRYPKTIDLVSTGAIVEDKIEGDRRVTHRRTESPVRFAGFNLGVYERVRVSKGGNTIEVCANRAIERALQPHVPMSGPTPSPPFPWTRPRRPPLPELPSGPALKPDPTAHLQQLASEVASALEFMAARFGPPPLRTITISPVPGTFGQGFPGLIYLSTLAYLGRQDKPLADLNPGQRLFFSEILQAHEVAHQWWGNVVTAQGYHDDWLIEALASYSALLYLEKRKGARAFESVLGQYKSDLLAKTETGDTIESTGPIVLGTRLESSQSPRAWRTITYAKGSWILHMLRRRMGDEQFLEMLARLAASYQRSPITTDQFRLLAAESLPPKWPDPGLENFFDQWVYGTGIPALELKYSLRGKAPALKLVGTIKQTAVPEDFSIEAPVEIQFGRAKALTHWVRTGAQPVTFTLPLRQTPARVMLDPWSSVLAVRK